MTKTISRSLLLAAGLLAATKPAAPVVKPTPRVSPDDPRTERIRDFFAVCECPAERYAKDFVQAADQHNLDWRLLPSISMVESTGGKAFKNNNIFGWANGEHRFRSVPEGIYVVASKLKRARPYRGKTLEGKLRAYNPNLDYLKRVKATMRLLNGPATMAVATR